MRGIGLNTRPRLSSSSALVVAFPVLWILAEIVQGDDARQPRDSLDLAAGDLARSMLSLLIWLVSRRLQRINPPSVNAEHLPTCAVPFREPSSSSSCSDCREPHARPGPVTLAPGNVRSTLSILVVSLVFALRAYIDVRTQEFVDPFTLSLAFPATVLCILALTPWRNLPSACWHASLLQFAGLFITRDAVVGPALPPASLLTAFSFCNSIWVSLVELIYGLHPLPSVHLINTAIFAQACLIHFLLFLLLGSHSIPDSYHDRFALTLQTLPLLDAAKDVVALFVIQQHGAISQGILAALASTFLIAVDTWNFAAVPGSAFLGCLIAVLGSVLLFLCEHHADKQHQELLISGRRCFAVLMISIAALGYTIAILGQNSWTNSLDLSSIRRKLSGTSGSRPDCRVPESSALIHTQTIANYTHFNNVLLIVFFSHARYDANLDFHREVYSDYFPNIVYVGPASREDKGFAHSYDVLVDSFQSEEDLSDPLFYRMSGRMAHHMLYTALREYGCYDGYLWVPFDTLLNIPRLQLFNQSLFWYHSPWGQPVPNLALGNITEPVLNVSQHAPPAMISPDPSINLTETWRGWGPDWWWGDPHVGVSVCMNAFHQVPEHMRSRLVELNDGQTRLIGGSADTLYIPGRHRKTFMDTLALFLETDCFLEIATPTTVHLVVPRGEPIQFVDHWWIYQPPFNASFVRDKWAEGYEVDTFHTFHWGERDEDGIWRGNHRHVADVRHLLRESANRQGLGDTFPVKGEVDDP